MALAVAGTALVAGGAAVLNQVYERDTDALMRRTRLRPLPDGRVSPRPTRGSSGCAISACRPRAARRAREPAGGGARAGDARRLPDRLHADEAAHARSRRSSARCRARCRRSSAGRRRTAASRCGRRGAVRHRVPAGRFPHFMAIAWLYRDDYGKAGFPMLSVIDPEGRRSGRQALLYAIALIPVTLVPTLVGVSGMVYGGPCARCSARIAAGSLPRFAIDAQRRARRARCSSARSPICRFSGS